jgi:hypothetical protein
MAQTVGVSKAITNLNEAHARLSISPADQADFFSEWASELPALSAGEQQVLDRLKARYQYYQAEGAITESTVDIILVSPLLELLGLCDPPYKIRGEKFVRVEIENGDTVLEGLIDVLVVQESFWLVLLESKRYGFSVMQALPQTLAYMVSGGKSQVAVFGLITTGEDYLFVKLDPQQQRYDVSDKFTLSTRQGNQLHRVAAIIKRLIGLNH